MAALVSIALKKSVRGSRLAKEKFDTQDVLFLTMIRLDERYVGSHCKAYNTARNIQQCRKHTEMWLGFLATPYLLMIVNKKEVN